jgi:ribonuclease HII
MVDLAFEQRLWQSGAVHVAGVDEAGRGPLAGPVVAAAVVFRQDTWIEGVDDSKKLTHLKRERLYEIILREAVCCGIGIIDHTIIDEINIYHASLRAMAEAVGKLTPSPGHLLIDGPRYQQSTIPHTAIVDGDAKCFSIAAASVVAKVTRDRLMLDFDRQFPEYGFARHKGYATPQHIAALGRHGLCAIHRRSFCRNIEPATHLNGDR